MSEVVVPDAFAAIRLRCRRRRSRTRPEVERSSLEQPTAPPTIAVDSYARRSGVTFANAPPPRLIRPCLPGPAGTCTQGETVPSAARPGTGAEDAFGARRCGDHQRLARPDGRTAYPEGDRTVALLRFLHHRAGAVRLLPRSSRSQVRGDSSGGPRRPCRRLSATAPPGTRFFAGRPGRQVGDGGLDPDFVERRFESFASSRLRISTLTMPSGCASTAKAAGVSPPLALTISTAAATAPTAAAASPMRGPRRRQPRLAGEATSALCSCSRHGR